MLQWKPKGKKGFSLIELLVVVAIIGVLAAVAIPAYNRYRVDAQQGAITSSLNNIGKAFAACRSLRPFRNCATLQDIGVDCPECDKTRVGGDVATGRFCAQSNGKTAGVRSQGCVTTTGGIPTIIGNWPMLCRRTSIEYTCTAANTLGTAPAVECRDLDCTATNPVPTNADCMAAGPIQHNCATANLEDLTNAANSTGVCNPSDGTCS